MNKELLIDAGLRLSRLRMYPYFDICHYLITSTMVRDDILLHQTTTPNFSRRHPLSCWLSSMLLCFAGSIMSNFLLGESPIKDFQQHQHLLLASICWYLVFYSPFDLIYKLLKFMPIKLFVGIMKEIQRTKKIYDGVHHTMHIYPDAYIIIVIIGTVKGCAGSVMASVDRFVRGVWLPNQHEFLYPTFATKACMISAIIFTMEHYSLIKFDRELIYLCVASAFIYVKIISVFFKQYDPLMPFENLSCGLLFNSWVDAVSDAFHRTQAATTSGASSLASSTSLTPIAGSSSSSSTAIVSKKDGMNGSIMGDGVQQAKGLDLKKRE
ncbi:unnamed protein product [Didymodactylos carnosus]|uniref:Trimeric intracellular cation channel type B n=1 Tax=Didymodactylos carnosus TaxID=1234261 RepID=A0A813PMZ8_9BILA|nr:unnamed protein product [Didymodactylos carnosus]CAF0755226.1 unnamed protein product [Didymodactylos carnosus]CAF3523162.1 unnamed protein product [Didymodactylos carnosus]CAF3535497.1 unnamed protein product [Didymodactylos carnosus]